MSSQILIPRRRIDSEPSTIVIDHSTVWQYFERLFSAACCRSILVTEEELEARRHKNVSELQEGGSEAPKLPNTGKNHLYSEGNPQMYSSAMADFNKSQFQGPLDATVHDKGILAKEAGTPIL
jgi:hypothetical protein